MYKIINQKIILTRGESATFDAEFRDSDGAPTRIPAQNANGDPMSNTYIEFIVRETRFENSDIVFKLTFEPDPDFKYFTDLKIYDWDGVAGFETGPTGTEEDALYRYDNNGVIEYAYVDNGAWVEYNFPLKFEFMRDYTEDVEPGKYWYEIAFFGDNYKKTLVDAKVFEIGGSISGE